MNNKHIKINMKEEANVVTMTVELLLENSREGVEVITFNKINAERIVLEKYGDRLRSCTQSATLENRVHINKLTGTFLFNLKPVKVTESQKTKTTETRTLRRSRKKKAPATSTKTTNNNTTEA